MPIAPLLQRFVDDELKRSADLIARTTAATLEQLRQPRDSLLSASERQHYFDLVQALQQHQAKYQRDFCEALRRLVLADLAPQAPAVSLAELSLGGLQLMDESRVESEIEISRAIQLIDNGAEWELRELQTFTSTLRGQAHVSAESNPLRAQSFARALWQAASALPVAPVQQVILLRVSASVMAGLLRMALAAATTRLESQGVTPGIYRTVVIEAGVGHAPAPPELDVTRPGALDGLRSSMPTGGDGNQTGSQTGHHTSGAPERQRRAAALASPAMEQALLRIEELLRRLPSDAAAPRLLEHRVALMATTGETVERQIIELISRLFETLLSDRTLPAGLRGVMARLQVSALRIALADPAMLDAYDHPVWVLMDRMVNATTTYPHASDPRLAALLAFCETLVSDMAAEPAQDTALYRRSLLRLETFLAEQLRQQQVQAQATVDALTRAEQAEQLQRSLSGRLQGQMAPIQTTGLIRRFVTHTWARVLAEAVLRFGDSHAQTAGYLKAVDELLWSLQLPNHPQSRQRLVTLLPGLLQRLRTGMGLIDVPAAEQQTVLDELMRLHAEALRPGPRAVAAPAEALSPEEIVRQMRDEAHVPHDEPEPLGASGFSDSLIDLASMETVPAALMNADGSTEEAHQGEPDAPTEWVRHMHVGARYRIFLHGAWAHVQLLWRSEQNHFFLFAGEAPNHTHSVTQRALERLREAELLGPLHAHSLIQRAVDGMLRHLARQP